MKRKLMLSTVVSILVTVSPVFAHDHGGAQGGAHDHSDTQGSPQHAAAQDEQSVKESAELLDRCAQQVAGIYRRISKLQAEFGPKHTAVSMNEELKKLELKLKEANEIVRPLQIF